MGARVVGSALHSRADQRLTMASRSTCRPRPPSWWPSTRLTWPGTVGPPRRSSVQCRGVRVEREAEGRAHREGDPAPIW